MHLPEALHSFIPEQGFVDKKGHSTKNGWYLSLSALLHVMEGGTLTKNEFGNKNLVPSIGNTSPALLSELGV